MILYYKKTCIKCKNSDLSWALHSLDCLGANIFKTTFFCQVFAYFTPLLATENDIVRLLSEMTLGSSFLSAQKTPASIWPNFFSRPTRNGIFANKYFFFTLAVFSLNELNSYWVLLTQENASVKKPTKLFGLTYFYRHSSYNAVLLYRCIPSIAVFLSQKPR